MKNFHELNCGNREEEIRRLRAIRTKTGDEEDLNEGGGIIYSKSIQRVFFDMLKLLLGRVFVYMALFYIISLMGMYFNKFSNGLSLK